MGVRANPLEHPPLPMGMCTQSPGTFVFCNLSNVAEIAVIHLVFTICILRNSYKWCALIIALFTMSLPWFLGVDGTQIPLLDSKMVCRMVREKFYTFMLIKMTSVIRFIMSCATR